MGEYYNGEYPFYKPTDLEQGINTLTSSDSLTLAGLEASRFLPKRSILVTCIGATIGKTGVIQREGSCNQQINAIIPYSYCNPSYIYYCIISGYIQNAIKSNASATTLPILNKSDFSNLLFPLPPFSEQQRIVQDIEKWFALIDDIEAHKSDLLDYIKQAKSKVLDLAIHGKLVPQDPNDEPAIDLLKRINPSFKPCDTSHYENLPENWGMVSIGQLCTIIGGLWTGKKPPFINVGVIRNTNFTKDFKLDLTNTAYLDVEVKQFNTRRLQYGDIILEKSGGSEKQPVGRTILFDRKEGEFSFSNFTAVLRIKETNLILSKFLHFALINAYLNGATRFMQKQTTGIHNLIMDKYMALSVPIPPLAEQKRIVEAIEKVFDKFNSVTAEL